jgi:predicted amidophosphoribosyltransferase
VPSVVDDLVRALLPARCPGCGARAEPVCAACVAGAARARPVPPPAPLAAWSAPFAYEGVVRELVARVKYRNARHAIPWLAEQVCASAPGAVLAADAVVWAPTDRSRARTRGFDHAELLARAVAARLGLPAVALLSRDPGPPQTGRPAPERRAGPGVRALRAPIDARILLVDDVVTTGGTLVACARALRHAGAPQVTAAAIARTQPPGGGAKARR